ncbi:cytochrome P450 [Aspergillus unguis]
MLVRASHQLVNRDRRAGILTAITAICTRNPNISVLRREGPRRASQCCRNHLHDVSAQNNGGVFQMNWDINEHPRDVVSWLLKAYVEKDVSTAPSATALHDGSRANPDVLKKLQRLLDEAMPGGPSEWTYDTIKNIGYLEDIITETLRLRPAILTGGSRVTPAEGLQVDKDYIPGDVNVFVPTQLIQMGERYYVDAKTFIP